MIRSVRFKLGAFIMGAVVFAGIVLELFHYSKSVELMLKGAGGRGQTLAKGLAFNSYTGVYARQEDPILPLIDGVLEDKDVLYVRVVAYVEEKDGSQRTQVVLSTERDAVKGKLGLDTLTREAFARGGEDLSKEKRENGIRYLDIAAPVQQQAGLGGGFGSLDGGSSEAKAEKIGFVQIGYNLAPVYADAQRFARVAALLLGLVAVIGIIAAYIIATRFVAPLSAIVAGSRRIAQGDLSQLLVKGADARDELGELMRSFNQMVVDLRRSRGEVDEYNKNLASKVDERTKEVEQAYVELKSSQSAQTAYSEVLRTFNETADVDGVLREGLKGLVRFTEATIGAVHVWDERDRKFHVSATQGLSRQTLPPFSTGEGFAGQAAADRRLHQLADLGDDARWTVRNIAGDMRPREILAAPIIYRDEVLGVVELGTVSARFEPQRLKLLEDLVGQFAIALSNVIANERTRQLAQTLQAKGRELEQQNRTLSEQSGALQRQQRELDDKNKDLERASKLKSEFLANMSHELRTPMNSIIGYTDLVLNRAADTLDPRHKKNLDKVLANAQHLLSLINGILDLSKIEAGKMELFQEEFELPPLLESTAAMAEVLIKGKPVKLVQKIETGLPRMRTDKTKLRQIMLNLLSNACKFTENGNVTLTAESIDGRRKGDPNRLLKIEVTDSGIGISEKDLPIIFEEFRQVDGSSTRKYGGTGLGLAIVKRMVILMGGEITVRSELGQGSTFTVVLPLGEAATAEAAARAEAEAAKAQAERELDRGTLRAESAVVTAGKGKDEDEDARKTILVVDDEPDSVILVRENLSGMSYRVVSAFTAEEGMRMAKKTKPFAILLDIMMPDKDGWDLIRELKDDEETSAIPIVILSIVDNKPLGFSLGATDYLLKPIDRDALVQSLTRIAIRPVRQILVVDDDEGVREILDDMLKREGYQVQLAQNGVEAIASLGDKPPDLIILDLMMPEMDGFEVVRHLRSNKAWTDIPVLICTAKELTQVERADLQRSVSRIVEKGSMQQDILLGELGTALRSIEAQILARAQSKEKSGKRERDRAAG